MTKKKKGGITYKGPVPDDDPMYQNSGWNFLLGDNLNPNPKSETAAPRVVKIGTPEEWENLTGEPAN